MPVEPLSSAWVFPDPTESSEDIVAVGADMAPGTVLSAYRQGIFPMPLDEVSAMAWWSPVERAVLPLDNLRVTRSMRKSARRFRVTVDEAFPEVLEGCADPVRPGGWIDDQVRSTYSTLYTLGWVHSVEVWRDDVVVGGLYGVAIGGLFAGESMFHHERDASKVALMTLVELLDDGRPHCLLDVQWCTDHLRSLGAIEMPRSDYLALLRRALAQPLPERWR